ncbi:MAG: hypothetical protein KJO81_12845 [Gammaproteobacteria bacterium]|nr:hypothetical protein [Gammaproteobacteria bacterium]NNC67347.1 hypothetical protein [Gammaproteobacteria bacterium]
MKTYKGETLVVHDHKDRVIPISEADIIANSIEATTLFATSGCGHFRILAE